MGVNGENTVPDGWEVTPLSQVATVQTGVAKNGNLSGDIVMMPYLRVANVQDGRLDLAEIKQTRVRVGDVARYRLQDGDVLFTEGGDFDKLGRCVVWRGEVESCLHQNHIFAVRTAPKTLDATYLALLASSDYGRNYFRRCSKQTTNLASINSTQLKAFPVVLPPRPEQDRIAAILSAWAKAEELCTALIDAKRRLRAAIVTPMLERNGEPTRLGDVMEESRLRNNGLTVGPDIVRAVNKVEGMIPMKENVIGSSLDRYKVVRKDWFAYNPMRLNIGSIARWQEERDVLVSPDYVVLRCRDGLLDAHFLDHLRRSPRWTRFVREAGNGSVRVRIYYADLARLRVPLPPLAEQRRIAAVLSTLDREIALLRDYLAALKKQKRGLMQLLLTGKIRVHPDSPLTPNPSPPSTRARGDDA